MSLSVKHDYRAVFSYHTYFVFSDETAGVWQGGEEKQYEWCKILGESFCLSLTHILQLRVRPYLQLKSILHIIIIKQCTVLHVTHARFFFFKKV